uniref:RNase H type-1 domain-containing protein n=1 Tax=Rousettus aegyptiacus TaxID=9407 RepID=A0A7J8CI18_ROUAE|nr:hypothetical protein HJG63_009067 [Rousettus aegyptiacus]
MGGRLLQHHSPGLWNTNPPPSPPPPATLMPAPDLETPLHHCVETSEQTYSSRLDLKDGPSLNPDAKWVTDGSSFIHKGLRKAGHATVNLSDVIEANALPANTSAQKAELTALIRALQLGKGLTVNIYTDLKHKFVVLHEHAATWKE